MPKINPQQNLLPKKWFPVRKFTKRKIKFEAYVINRKLNKEEEEEELRKQTQNKFRKLKNDSHESNHIIILRENRKYTLPRNGEKERLVRMFEGLY